MVTEKIPEDCSKDELNRYLIGKGFKIHPNTSYAELLQQTKLHLLSQGKSKIICPENSIFGVLRHYGRQAMDLVSTKSEPPVQYSNFERSRFYVKPIPERHYQISEFSENIYDEPSVPEAQTITDRFQNVTITQPRPLEPVQNFFNESQRCPDRTHVSENQGLERTQIIASGESVVEHTRAPRAKRVRVEPDISRIEPQNMSLPRPQVQPPTQPFFNLGREPMESSPNQNHISRLPQKDLVPVNETFSFGKYPKFTQKYDASKVSIEDYLQCLDRWRSSHNIPDVVAISTCLDNFVDIMLANNIDGSISDFEKSNFDSFMSSLIEKLGRPSESYMDDFESMKRLSSEKPFAFLSRLCSALKKGNNIAHLTQEHRNIILRRFINGSHRTVKEQLKLRNDVTFENVAELSRRIELAYDIKAGATVSINALDTQTNVPKISNRPQAARYNSPPPKRDPCHICNQVNHMTKHCYGNLASPYFSKEKFEKFNKPQKN